MTWTEMLSNFLHNPDEYGINLFIVGILFMLSSYHFFLYVQNNDKSYLFYQLFTGFTLFYLLVVHTSCCDNISLQNNLNVSMYLSVPLQWIYNTLYVLFIKEFTNFKKYHPKWNLFLDRVILVLIASILVIVPLAFLLNSLEILFNAYKYFFLPCITIVSILSLIKLSKFKTNLKYYALSGSIVFLVFSLIAQGFEFYGNRVTGLFYLAIIIENVFFALGLGFKQKTISEEKLQLQNRLITQLEENKELENRIKNKLENELSGKTKKIQSLAKINAERNRKKLKAEYEHKLIGLKFTALQSQMNPHFLFNSLNSIKAFIIQNNKKEAIFYLNKFSVLIRNVLKNSTKHFISLQEELEFLELYLKIENIRLDNKINYTINIDKSINTSDVVLPPLILQPFIENSIWHGLSTKESDKKLQINVFKKDDDIVIEIEDNGIGRRKAEEIRNNKFIQKKSIGLQLTRDRLKSFEKIVGKPNSLEIIDKVDSDKNALGTKIIVKV